MGVMMWMMMRKDHGHASPPVSDPRVAELESQVNELRMAMQERPSGGGAEATVSSASADKGWVRGSFAIGRRRPSLGFQSTGPTVNLPDISVSGVGVGLIGFLGWFFFGPTK